MGGLRNLARSAANAATTVAGFSLASPKTNSSGQQAADLLNVSRPYVVSLIGKGVLPVRMVGNQRRVPLKELLAYKAESTAKAFDALEEMSAIDQELGLR